MDVQGDPFSPGSGVEIEPDAHLLAIDTNQYARNCSSHQRSVVFAIPVVTLRGRQATKKEVLDGVAVFADLSMTFWPRLPRHQSTASEASARGYSLVSFASKRPSVLRS
jgi:hypothetical protein